MSVVQSTLEDPRAHSFAQSWFDLPVVCRSPRNECAGGFAQLITFESRRQALEGVSTGAHQSEPSLLMKCANI